MTTVLVDLICLVFPFDLLLIKSFMKGGPLSSNVKRFSGTESEKILIKISSNIESCLWKVLLTVQFILAAHMEENTQC